MTRQNKVMLHVLGTVEDLREIGLVTMEERLTDQGRQKVAQLRAEGFEPTLEEKQKAIRALMATSGLRIDPAAMKDENQN